MLSWENSGDFISKVLETGKINLEVENCKSLISFVGSLFLVVLVGVLEVAESLEICGFLREFDDLVGASLCGKSAYLLKKSER